MIHAIYLKSRPKHKWHLASVSISPEMANVDMEEILKQAKSTGNEKAEAAIQIFDSSFYIPEILSNITHQDPSFN